MTRLTLLLLIALVAVASSFTPLSTRLVSTRLFSTSSAPETTTTQEDWFYKVPDDAVVTIRPQAMRRLMELQKQQKSQNDETLTLRMGVRSGGCSGMSYVMDIVENVEKSEDEDDAVDVYDECKVQCVVDSKSLLYLYGMELDYSDALVGGGFRFINPNAEETCGCGSSFGV